eukprot:scaffold32718_cov51-Cyclotella_meneghiniana.AAC.1
MVRRFSSNPKLQPSIISNLKQKMICIQGGVWGYDMLEWLPCNSNSRPDSRIEAATGNIKRKPGPSDHMMRTGVDTRLQSGQHMSYSLQSAHRRGWIDFYSDLTNCTAGRAEGPPGRVSQAGRCSRPDWAKIEGQSTRNIRCAGHWRTSCEFNSTK